MYRCSDIFGDGASGSGAIANNEVLCGSTGDSVGDIRASYMTTTTTCKHERRQKLVWIFKIQRGCAASVVLVRFHGKVIVYAKLTRVLSSSSFLFLTMIGVRTYAIPLNLRFYFLSSTSRDAPLCVSAGLPPVLGIWRPGWQREPALVLGFIRR